jgi:hypothetical protein
MKHTLETRVCPCRRASARSERLLESGEYSAQELERLIAETRPGEPYLEHS